MKATYLLLIPLTFLLSKLSAQSISLNESQTYAVVVGISDYQDEDIPDLKYADKDAEYFAEYLQSPAGGQLDEDHLKVLINEDATVAQFAMALDWLWEVAAENDKVILYFSGHGDVERKSLSQPGFLLCWDAPSRVYMTGGTFALSMLQEVISTLSVQNKAKVIMIADACRSGKLSGSTIGGAQITGANLARQYANEIKILSCQPDEYSIEGKQWGGGHGVFSYFLLDGLYGFADVNDDLKIDLKELGRYLEDNVSEQVEPQTQNPMIIGNRTETLTKIDPEILAQITEHRKGDMQVFAGTEHRGIVDEALSQADSSTIFLYNQFYNALKTKTFLEPPDECANQYYEQLMAETSLKALHSSLRRNYAAALQDEAQQVMNRWLKADVRELSRSRISMQADYHIYPSYLERAAELLGESHYMYKVLQARKLFFEGFLMHLDNRFYNPELGRTILKKYRAALKLQPEMPQVLFGMELVHFFQMQQIDSAEHYANLANELVPSWFLPHAYLGFAFSNLSHQDFEKARFYLEKADKADSTARKTNLWHMTIWATYYKNIGKIALAEDLFLKAIALDPALGPYNNLANLYIGANRFAEAEENYIKAIHYDSTHIIAMENLGTLYIIQQRFEDAQKTYDQALLMDPENVNIRYNLACMHSLKKDADKAFSYLEEALQLGYSHLDWLQKDPDLVFIREMQERWTEMMKKYFSDQIKD